MADDGYVYDDDGYAYGDDDGYAYGDDDGYAYGDDGGASGGAAAVSAEACAEQALNALFQLTGVHTVERAHVAARLEMQAAQLRDLCWCSLAVARLILLHHRFNVDIAAERVMSEREQVLEVMRLPAECFAADASVRLATPAEVQGGAECLVCYCEDGEGDGRLMTVSSCGHFVCRDCWRRGVLNAAGGEQSVLEYRCLAEGCSHVVDYRSLLEQLRPDGADAPATAAAADTTSERVLQSVIDDYVTRSPRLCWCANPHGCPAIISSPVPATATALLECPACSYPFCSGCMGSPHAPATCSEIEDWKNRVQNGGANVSFILTNTKPCPKCKQRIEKNAGCNHMTCKCKHEFCWVCLGAWSAHGGMAYSCSMPAKDVPRESTGDRDMTLFVPNILSYEEHQRSSTLERRSVDVAERILRNAEVGVPSPSDFDVLASTRRALTLGRGIMCATYVKAFFLALQDAGESELNLLYYRRGRLQMAVEEASRVLGQLSAGHIVEGWQAQLTVQVQHIEAHARAFYE